MATPLGQFLDTCYSHLHQNQSINPSFLTYDNQPIPFNKNITYAAGELLSNSSGLNH
jgi:hypothetical protein